VIERDLPGVGGLTNEQLGGAAKTSNAALRQIPASSGTTPTSSATRPSASIAPRSEDKIREHARKVRLPASKISEVVAGSTQHRTLQRGYQDGAGRRRLSPRRARPLPP
jgi:hypothetical protein